MNPDALIGLRDYHLPAPLGWWPPAPGWWVLGLLLLAAFGVAWLLRRRRLRQRRAPQLALSELARLRAQWRADADDLAFVRALSVLLRRYVLARYPADEAAGLNGSAWIAYLRGKLADAPAGVREALAVDVGRALAEAPYQRHATLDAAALADAVAGLFRHGERAASRGKRRC
jgi:hypothetical protein